MPTRSTPCSKWSQTDQGYADFSRDAPIPIPLPECTRMTGRPLVNGTLRQWTWYNGTDFYAPSPTPRFVASPCNFLPVTTPEKGGGLQSISEGQSLLGCTPPSSPFQYKKASPTPSLLTVTTIDSFESVSSLDSSNRAHCPYLFQPLWVPPRDISVCRVLETRFEAAQERKSPLDEVAKKKTSWPREEQDPVRKSRIKTELCMHFENGIPCPFGANCTYAHGDEELQMTKLMDLHRAGLIELDTYRTKPCLTWISTGSCPFGKRCSGIHDPRVAGAQQSWLPHTETQGNTIATDINVEALHQKRLNTILQDNPFGEQFVLGLDDFDALRKTICNIGSNNGRRKWLAEHHKVDIALQMRSAAGWHYKFRPQHIIYDELCMMLQKRAFHLGDGGQAVEIPLNAYNRLNNQVLVREIAFGPDSDPTVRGVALWFDIAEKDVTLCTPQQAKRYRWKRGLKHKRECGSPPVSAPSSLSFENKEFFTMVRPLETDAYNLATDILACHLGELRAARIGNLNEKSFVLNSLKAEQRRLRNSFDHQLQDWKTWAWPVNHGRAEVDENTSVPLVDGPYTPLPSIKDSRFERKEPVVKRVWDSFVYTYDSTVTQMSTVQTKRLPVLEALSAGASVSHESVAFVPHIKKHHSSGAISERPKTQDSQRCWKALLLVTSHSQEVNEWEAVKEHFQNSRSKKVLSIIQQ